MKRRRQGRNAQNRAQLEDMIRDVWTNIGSDVTLHLVKSMNRRIQAVISAKRGQTAISKRNSNLYE